MNCHEATILVHALIDSELDAGHAREVEKHVAECGRCAVELEAYRALSQAVGSSNLRHAPPSSLRRRIDRAIPVPTAPMNRRSLLRGFALGTVASAAVVTGIASLLTAQNLDQRLVGEAVSAHLRSLQPERLTDVLSSDQHTVKPWFNGRVGFAPPVVDLVAQGFRLIGGRLDYIDGRPAAALVYRRRVHVINLFVSQEERSAASTRQSQTIQGFNIVQWNDDGLRLTAISDLNLEELNEFCVKFRSATAVPVR